MKHLTKASNLNEWINSFKEFQLDDLFETNILARSYLLKLESFQVHESEVSANITGSNGSIYHINLKISDFYLVGECSCPYQGNCKHLGALVIKCIS